jgi:hypothetical protein
MGNMMRFIGEDVSFKFMLCLFLQEFLFKQASQKITRPTLGALLIVVLGKEAFVQKVKTFPIVAALHK